MKMKKDGELALRTVDGQVVVALICKPSRRRAASRITAPRFQRLCRGADFLGKDK